DSINNGVVDYTQEVFNNAELATFFKAMHRLSKKTRKDICQQTGYHSVQIRAHETNKQTFSLKFLQQILQTETKHLQLRSRLLRPTTLS
ncbi:hypothetical protein EBT25_18005, partial [bacterium]|nr:hypothetical protein [bacterium]